MDKNSLIITVLLVLITGAVMMICHCVAVNIGTTINANPKFDANLAVAYAEILQAAIMTKKEAIVTQIICSIDNQQRQKLSEVYKKIFEKEMIAMLHREFTGDFRELIFYLMQTPIVYDTNRMHNALSGFNINKPVLAEILITRTNGQIAELIDTYNHVFDGLEHDIKAKTSGPFQNLLLSLLRHSRDETELVDEQLAKEDAMKLIKEGEGQKSINESVFNEVIATRNLVQLRLTFDFYHELADQDIETGIKQEFGGDDEAGFLALIKCVRNSSEYFADLLQNSINGPVTHELELIRLVVSRSEIDLASIKHAYHEKHHISLEEAIEANTNGAYGEALLALVKGNL